MSKERDIVDELEEYDQFCTVEIPTGLVVDAANEIRRLREENERLRRNVMDERTHPASDQEATQ